MNKKSSTRPTVHLIGHAHIDPVWLWRWPEGFAEIRATFRSALDRMKETPGYIFTASSAAFYEWVERCDPAMFREIRKRVADGRWMPIGGWWIEPDCNVPCGESFVRQGLYGQRYFEEKFGIRCRVGFSPDAFGHAGTLPKILSGCGLDNYLFMRPFQQENGEIPPLALRWRGDDGTEVKTLRVHRSYNAWTSEELEGQIGETVALAKGTPLASELFVFFGVGNHGGGPTKALLKQISAWQKSKEMPHLVYSSIDRFLDGIESKRLPVWRGEMQHHARGCYSAVSAVKTGMRRAELSLLAAEMWGSAALSALGRKPDTAGLGRAWKLVLFNQFHDILPGTSTPGAYTDTQHQLGAAIHAAETEASAARQTLCREIDTRGEGTPIVLFNHLPIPFHGVVATEDVGFHILDDGPGFPGVPGFTGAGGKPVSSQKIDPHTLAGRRRFAVHADIPALGYTVLHQVRVPARATPRCLGKRSVRAGKNQIENEVLRVGLDRRGYVTLFDKKRRRQVFAGAGAIPLVMDDRSDTWSHNVDAFRKKIGRFKRTDVSIIESGPVRGCLEVNYTWDDSRLRFQFLLGAGESHLLIHGRVDWRQSFQMLKLAFPVPFTADTWTADAPYGIAERRTTGEEEPIRQWADLSREGRGLAIANDGKYSCSAEPGELRLTILRSPPFSHHDPWVSADCSRGTFTDQGPHTFSLAVLPHAGDWREAGILCTAAHLNTPPTSLAEGPHPGPRPSSDGFARCRGKGVRIEAIKGSEDGKALILRAVEWYGRRRMATFELPALERDWSAAFRPHEVKTFRIPLRKRAAVREVTMLETC
jgi:alpha-mannosidase